MVGVSSAEDAWSFQLSFSLAGGNGALISSPNYEIVAVANNGSGVLNTDQ